MFSERVFNKKNRLFPTFSLRHNKSSSNNSASLTTRSKIPVFTFSRTNETSFSRRLSCSTSSDNFSTSSFEFSSFGLRISEVQQLRLCHIEQVLQGSTLEIYSSKTNSIHRQAVPEEAVEVFKSLKKEINLLFVEAKLTTLTDSVFRTKRTPMSNKHFIRYVNNDIEATLQKFEIAKNYRAHSFRVNLITQLLRTVWSNWF